MVKKEIVIIGAGASGLMAAGRYRDRDIALIEANPKIGQKIAISGGGKCNITNKYVTPKHYLGDPCFIHEVLRSYGPKELLADLKAAGLKPVLRKENQYFCPESAVELVNVLAKASHGVSFFMNERVEQVTKEKVFVIKTDKNLFHAQKVVFASGGLSFPRIGASDIAFRTAADFGHRVISPKPALVGFTLQKEQFWMKSLSGISLPVSVRVGQKRIDGDLLFAHRGISGPAVLNTSLYWEKGSIEIDFIPRLKLEKRFFQSRKQISTALGVPKRFVKAFLEAVGIKDQPLERMSQEEIGKLKQIKSYTFAPAGNFGFSKAEVTKGGISTDEIDPETMMSRKCAGLYFLGEALDVTGELGGYNFQWAFATAQRLKL
jgi:predicted Rossmann fold flavoprotein